MLKSTYRPSPSLTAPSPLPPGWTEHKAPTGHTYYYHADTKESTYKRPGVATDAAESFSTQLPVPQLQLSDPRVANAFVAQYSAPSFPTRGGGFGGGRGGGEQRSRPQPTDKPRKKVAIPGCEPWILVYTKYDRRFAYSPTKNESYWRIPDKLKAGILELDQARIRNKAGAAQDELKGHIGPEDSEARRQAVADGESDLDSSEYEEVEVTDDEGEEGSQPVKRQRTQEPVDEEEPVEFDESDIAYQLQAMEGLHGMSQDDRDDMDWDGDNADVGLSEEDARELFKDLLNDFNINPYSPWEKLIEEGKILDDARYLALDTSRSRRDAWEEWSRDKIKELKEQRAGEEKKDPRIPYVALLQERASPRLYWPEFKRKYKKESSMRDTALSDKDREKWYREYISRLKLPLATLKSDLTTLLKALPLSKLNNAVLPTQLPPDVLADLRYAALDAKVREPLVEGYIQTLGPPPEDAEAAREDEVTQKAQEARRRREMALRERERVVAEEKKRQQRRLEHEKAKMREEERELERALLVGRKGLQSQLATAPENNS